MLNVLIAPINAAFNTGDESWCIIWHENRLRYIESADNITLHLPGFRRAYSWFPNDVYYEAKYDKPVTSQFAKESMTPRRKQVGTPQPCHDASPALATEEQGR